MPDYTPVIRIVALPVDMPFKEWPQSSPFPPIEKMEDGGILIDRCHYPDHVRAKVWDRADHPNAGLLPENAPKIVKHLFTAAGQLALLRGDYEMAIKAMMAWEKYFEGQQQKLAG
jgi:hypothetical protein